MINDPEIETLNKLATDIRNQIIEDKECYKKTGRHFLTKEQQKEVGQQLHNIEYKIKEMNAKKEQQKLLDLPYMFMMVCREKMRPIEFNKYKKVALDRIYKDFNIVEKKD